MKELLTYSVCTHRENLARGAYSAVELTRAYLEEIERTDPVVGAFLTVDAERALRAASASDARRRVGERLGALDGIPFSLKDNICVRGMRMTCASRILENYIAPYDATVTERLQASGGVLIGKNNMDEFAMGSSNEYSAFRLTRNPHDPTRVSGGSSGGSAAAVASHEVAFALGTDTGGSVRQPAAFCGVYGLKPTYGVLSRYGVAAMATSLDCVGILASTAEDCGWIFDALVGRDERDATSVAYWNAEASSDTTPLRVGVVDGFGEELAGDVLAAYKHAAEDLKQAGAIVETVSLPYPRLALAAYTVIAAAEASSNLARYDGIRYGRRSEGEATLSASYDRCRAEGFGEEVKRRILFGTDLLSTEHRQTYYVRALRVRELIRHEMAALLERYDVLLSPTAPTVAFKRGEKPSRDTLRCADLCTVYASLSGFPALSVPVGRNADGLPLAVQLTGAPFSERRLLRAARFVGKGGYA